MIQSAAVSARSVLIAGISAAVVATATVAPVDTTDLATAKITAVATQLTSITTPLENAIKDTYNAVEPWVAWGFELAQWGLGFVPGLWWIAPGIDLAYFTIEPLVQAGVFAFADVVGLNFGQIWPDISTGINQSVTNAVNYAWAWITSLVPFPPLPPFPPRPGAAVAASPLAAAATSVLAGTSAKSITTPIEVAIKNTYNAVEPWARYGMQWADYLLGLVPIVNWFSPVIPLTYNTIEPLFRAGTYAFADLIGLNFAAIGPDVWNGITTSANNFITGVLNWANIPLPPPLPGAAVSAPPAASLRAAAAVTPPAELPGPVTPATTGAATGLEPKADDAAAIGKEAPAPAETPEIDSPATQSAPAGGLTTPVDTETPAPKAEAPEPKAEVALPALTELPAAGAAAAPAGKAHRGPGASATSGDSDNAGAPAKPGRHARGSD